MPSLTGLDENACVDSTNIMSLQDNAKFKQTFNGMLCLAIVLEDMTVLPSLHLLNGVSRRN